MTEQPPHRATADVFDPAGIEWTSVSPALARVRRTVLLSVLTVVAVVAAVIATVADWDWAWVVVALALVGAGWGWWTIGRQVAAWGYAERADDLLIRRGL